MSSSHTTDVGRGRASLDQGDLVPGTVEGNLVHEGLDQEQAAPACPLEVGRVSRVGQPGGIEPRTLVADEVNRLPAGQPGPDVEPTVAIGGPVTPELGE